MRRRFATLFLIFATLSVGSFSADQKEPAQGHYLSPDRRRGWHEQ